MQHMASNAPESGFKHTVGSMFDGTNGDLPFNSKSKRHGIVLVHYWGLWNCGSSGVVCAKRVVCFKKVISNNIIKIIIICIIYVSDLHHHQHHQHHRRRHHHLHHLCYKTRSSSSSAAYAPSVLQTYQHLHHHRHPHLNHPCFTHRASSPSAAASASSMMKRNIIINIINKGLERRLSLVVISSSCPQTLVETTVPQPEHSPAWHRAERRKKSPSQTALEATVASETQSHHGCCWPFALAPRKHGSSRCAAPVDLAWRQEFYCLCKLPAMHLSSGLPETATARHVEVPLRNQ